MIDRETEQAMQLLRRKGYAVIPREEVKTLGAQHTVDNATMLKLAEAPGFMGHIRRDIFHSLVGVLEREDDWVKIDKRDDPAHFNATIFSARLQIIPHKWEADPFLQMLRERP